MLLANEIQSRNLTLLQTRMPLQEITVCRSNELGEKGYVIIDVIDCGKPHSAIVLRYQGKLYAYLNQCVHMPRRLNCERDTVFDADRKLLRCSMHGIVYQPDTGESRSTLCQGEKLTALRLREEDGRIVLFQRHLSLPS